MNAPVPSASSPCKRKTLKVILKITLIIVAVLLATGASLNFIIEGSLKKPVSIDIIKFIMKHGFRSRDVIDDFVHDEAVAALQAYKNDVGQYPTTAQGLQALISKPDGVRGWKGPYLTNKGMLMDPWGNPYQYACPSTHGQPTSQYDCWSFGPDGQNGTADDIGNWQPYL
jgi:type II secretion system protein G